MNTRSEYQLLLCCARTKLSEDNQDTIGKLVGNGLDWNYLLQMSKTHRLTPLLYYPLPGEESEELVKRFLTKLMPNYQIMWIDGKDIWLFWFEL